jgi:hypothetical protein
MTDDEFFTTVDSLSEHAKVRRQESLAAADVERFKDWDRLLGQLDTMLLRRVTEQNLRKLQGN